ncbi:MAG TPA: hypothetical protein VFE53_01685 [Mucilaginibacter sp.]|jgi:hypothetical protein|nr:hypothetical protein [Mucilaginibacter sp.]
MKNPALKYSLKVWFTMMAIYLLIELVSFFVDRDFNKPLQDIAEEILFGLVLLSPAIPAFFIFWLGAAIAFRLCNRWYFKKIIISIVAILLLFLVNAALMKVLFCQNWGCVISTAFLLDPSIMVDWELTMLAAILVAIVWGYKFQESPAKNSRVDV